MTHQVARQSRWETKSDVLAGGDAVWALTYERASQDRKEQGKSVNDQRKLNHADVTRHGWRLRESFMDNDRSASRHARKHREQFELLKEAIRAGRGDVLVVWEISRRERDLRVFTEIRDLCMESGLNYWLVSGVLYDIRDRNDRMMLGMQAVQAEFQADYIRDNVMRGLVGAAEAGRPPGKIAYGYRRIYDTRTKALLRQEPDTEIHEAVAADGTVTEYTRAGIIQYLFEEVSSGTSLHALAWRLTEQGVPSPRGGVRWRNTIIRTMTRNPVYIGKRVFRGEVIGDGQWPPLIDAETYWACVRRLEDPARVTTRPARARHLLSFLVTCAKCGSGVRGGLMSTGSPHARYACFDHGCAAIREDQLDEFVQRTVVAWLSRDDVYEALSADYDDEATTRARAEAQQVRAELEQWRQLAERREVSPESFVRMEKSLLAQIAAAEQRATESSIPPILRGRTGPQAIGAWAALGDEIAVKREIISAVADIRIRPAGKGSRKGFTPERLIWKWKLGPAADDATSAETAN